MKNIIYFLFLAVVWFLTFQSQAQGVYTDLPGLERKSSGVSFGLHAGVSASTGIYNYKNGPEPPLASILIGPTGGVNIDFRISNGFSIESILAYRLKGDRIDIADWIASVEEPVSNGNWIVLTPEADGYVQTKIGYFEIALLPVFHFSDNFRFGIGGYGCLGLHGEEKSDYQIDFLLDGEIFTREIVNDTRTIEFADLISSEDNETTRYLNSLDYGLVGFLGFGQSPLTFRLTFNYGLQTWEPDNNLLSSGELPAETYHLNGIFTVHYWFGK